MAEQRLRIEVRGIVQGVGFRPFVYRLARGLSLSGHVYNSAAGVVIEIQGEARAVAEFQRALPLDAPPLARLFTIEAAEIGPEAASQFVIRHSTHADLAQTSVPPDISTCDDCVREIFDQQDRRFRYPFTNCTNCGPRFTITRHLPYDRAQTAMAAFTMCALCQAEYDDPGDRRFHAQPNACPACGPELSLLDREGRPVSGDAVEETIRHLRGGRVVAIKGLGGFHLAVDADQPSVVDELRRRKGRGRKPFAVMIADRAAAARFCLLTDDDAGVLESPQRPIVLLRKGNNSLDSVAPDADHLGLFLPYTPLHHLLVGDGGLAALVMTSANRSDEPIAIDNVEAQSRLAGIADFFLMHNRDILLRCDDSVVQRIVGQTRFVRRARGFVPSPIVLAEAVPAILAVGGELKNTICLSRDRYAYPGQHVGDLEDLRAYGFFQESIAHLESLLEVKPLAMAHDLHPGYLSTQWAKRQTGIPRIAVQHHHAHIASCMAEHHLTGEVIGVALDGTGYGADGHVWGGEVLVASLATFTRKAHLAYVPMPGGERAIRESWRMAIACLWQTFGEEWRRHAPPGLLEAVPAREMRVVEQLLRTAKFCPLTSSCGRLFDAVAALACGRTLVTFEAEAAMLLESSCSPDGPAVAYPFQLREAECLQIDSSPLFIALLDDLDAGVSPGVISGRFHRGLVDVLARVVDRVAGESGLRRVCLSGGCFHNALLSEWLTERLVALGLEPYLQQQVPTGDGGLSLGQLVVAATALDEAGRHAILS